METQTVTIIEDIIKEALNSSISYSAYSEQMLDFSENRRTSGPEQTEALIGYTELNYRRMKRLDKTIRIDEKSLHEFLNIQKSITWLVITEAWCGDAAQVLPVLNKIAEATPKITLKLVYRDEHPELIDMFLTAGSRSIPKLIALNENDRVLYTWGPRPTEAAKMVVDFKNLNGLLTPDFKQDLQLWYNKDKGLNIIADQLALLNQLRP
tara:strand:- start:8652 stop:9278 length:627 start_codon:yes stop_codon:yes gene_type:complete